MANLQKERQPTLLHTIMKMGEGGLSLLANLVLLAAVFGSAKADITWLNLAGENLATSPCPLPPEAHSTSWLSSYLYTTFVVPNRGHWLISPIAQNYKFVLDGTQLSPSDDCIDGSQVTVVKVTVSGGMFL